MTETITQIAYLLAATILIIGLKKLSGVKTARRGNQLAALGMLIAVVTSLIEVGKIDYGYVIAGLVVGGLLGAILATRVQMTSMPELVALFNGLGGAASALVALSVVFGWMDSSTDQNVSQAMGADWTVTVLASIVIGCVTMSGSLVAYLKLDGKMSGNPVLLPARHLLNGVVFLGTIGCAVYLGATSETDSTNTLCVAGISVLALLLGWLLVIPIGGADMPVVISLLNSYSGLAAAMTGFVLHNNLLIISGSLVGASGLILTRIMCKAMNRSLANVLFGGFGAEESGGGGGSGQSGYTTVKECTSDEAAPILESAASVVFVPGYGLAVAQAQHAIRELAELLEGKGISVKYAIHPVAGRMPGHMNVLLAEANVPYEQLIEMDDINPEFKNTDVSIVVGANDVVNPLARDATDSPIYGMPILNVDESRTTFVIKRSLSPGFAGIDNPLFEADNSLMVYGDAKAVLEQLTKDLREM